MLKFNFLMLEKNTYLGLKETSEPKGNEVNIPQPFLHTFNQISDSTVQNLEPKRNHLITRDGFSTLLYIS